MATTPVAVLFGDGTAEMLTGTGGETTFTIAESGVYLFEFGAMYPADGDRNTPFIEIQLDSDDSVIGRSTNTYIRNSGSPEDGLIIVIDGIVTVASDSLVVKAVLGNAYNQNSMDADGGVLSLVRIGTGLRGAAGPAGAPGTGATFTIHDLDAETTIALPTRSPSMTLQTPMRSSASPASTLALTLRPQDSTPRQPDSLNWTSMNCLLSAPLPVATISDWQMPATATTPNGPR